MKATVMYRAFDVRVETVPDAHLIESTDALVIVTHAAICGSDLWPYQTMEHSEHGRRMGHEFIGVVDAVGEDVRSIKRGNLVVSPSSGRTGAASSAAKVCRARVSTAADTAPTMSAVGVSCQSR
jgi:threonine dehydrogenase-like Zn-dependent dehydrogenase